MLYDDTTIFGCMELISWRRVLLAIGHNTSTAFWSTFLETLDAINPNVFEYVL